MRYENCIFFFFFETHDFRDYFDRSETNQIALD